MLGLRRPCNKLSIYASACKTLNCINFWCTLPPGTRNNTRTNGMPVGLILVVTVTQRSVNAIKKIQPPKNKTELQEMIGKINFVRRFISNLSRRLEPFTPLLRLKADQKFTWGQSSRRLWIILRNILALLQF